MTRCRDFLMAIQWARLHLQCRAGSFNPGRGAGVPHALQPKKQNINQKQYCNKFNKGLKNGPHQKKKKSILKKYLYLVSIYFSLKINSSLLCLLQWVNMSTCLWWVHSFGQNPRKFWRQNWTCLELSYCVFQMICYTFPGRGGARGSDAASLVFKII